jgi:hypothetical protein
VKETMTAKTWNLFARELENILANRELSLEDLEDEAGIGASKLNRLRDSLSSPGHFPVLPSNELERISSVYALTTKERQRLHAAIIATAFEEWLIHYVRQDDALLAAERVFPAIVNAVQAYVPRQPGLIERKVEAPARPDDVDRLESALALIDRATAALYLCDARVYADRRASIRQARDGFEEALEELDRLNVAAKATRDFHASRLEAINGFETANDLLEDLL